MNKIFARALFKDKVNIVTGGGTGIGFGTAAGKIFGKNIFRIEFKIKQLFKA